MVINQYINAVRSTARKASFKLFLILSLNYTNEYWQSLNFLQLCLLLLQLYKINGTKEKKQLKCLFIMDLQYTVYGISVVALYEN